METFEQFDRNAAKIYSAATLMDGSNISDPASIIRTLSKTIRVKHYSYRTERSYIDWAKNFFRFLTDIKKKDIRTPGLTSEDVRDYLSFLALRKRVSSSTQNQAFNALLFLYRDVLDIELDSVGTAVRAKRGPKLPVVLTKEEVLEIFKRVSGKDKLILQLLYGTGMRISELTCLRVKDVDFGSGLIFIKSGKGDKDRSTILPEYIKNELRTHIEEVKKLHEKDLAAGYGEVRMPDSLEKKYPKAAKEFGWQYVFPSTRLSPDQLDGKIRRFYMTPKAIQVAMAIAVKKRVSPSMPPCIP